MSADIVNLLGWEAAAEIARGPGPGATTDREWAISILQEAAGVLASGNLKRALFLSELAVKTLAPLVAAGMTEADERREMERRHKRMVRGRRSAQTRLINRRRREMALNAAGIVLTRDGVIVTPPLPGIGERP